MYPSKIVRGFAVVKCVRGWPDAVRAKGFEYLGTIFKSRLSPLFAFLIFTSLKIYLAYLS
jgi:hypothetical protein